MFGSWGYVWFMDVGGGSESGGGGLMGILKPRGHHWSLDILNIREH